MHKHEPGHMPIDTSPSSECLVLFTGPQRHRAPTSLGSCVRACVRVYVCVCVSFSVWSSQAPGATVQLQRWSWHPSTLATLAAGLPALPHLSFALNLHKPLTDELLMAVVATNVHSLSVRSLSLQSDEHANTPWPWKQLTVETVDMAQLLKLPSPATACGGKAVIQFGGLGFEGVDQVCVLSLSTAVTLRTHV